MEIGEATVTVIPDFTQFDLAVQERRRLVVELAPAPVATVALEATRWVSDVAFEGVSTGDGRFMVEGSLGWRDLPLTLMAMIETPDMGGHAGAQVAGRMDTFEKDGAQNMDGEALAKGVTAIRATGVFDIEGDRGGEVARMVEDETLRGVSVDMAVMEWAFRDPETNEMIDPETADDATWERAFMGELEFAVVEGEIMAATVCPTPAFADARIALLASGFLRPAIWKANALCAASYGVPEGQLMTTLAAPLREGMPQRVIVDGLHRLGRVPLTAASVKASRVAAPMAAFTRKETREPCPLTFERKLGFTEVYGHLALWETCHTGFLNGEYSQCIRAPHSRTNYAKFHVGEHETEEGELLPIGTLTFDTGHASLSSPLTAARRHYDDTGTVAAFLRAQDGEYGIWVTGITESRLSEADLALIRACPPSGDWRTFEHNLELIAALSVPTPGFPIARSQLAIAASADGGIEVTALILTSGLIASNVNEFEVHGEMQALAAFFEGPEALDDLICG